MSFYENGLGIPLKDMFQHFGEEYVSVYFCISVFIVDSLTNIIANTDGVLIMCQFEMLTFLFLLFFCFSVFLTIYSLILILYKFYFIKT